MALTRVLAGGTELASDMNQALDMLNGNRSDALAFGSDIIGWGANLTLNALPVPAAPTITQGGAAGATNYTYKVVAVNSHGDGVPSSTTQTTTGNATLTGSNYNIVTWTLVQGATNYRVIRTASSGTPSSTGQLTTVGNGYPANGVAVTQPTIGTMSFNDTGLAATAYTDSTSNPGGVGGSGGQLGVVNLSGSQTTISFSSISQTYTHLMLLAYLRTDFAATLDDVNLRFNSDSGGTNYYYTDIRNAASALSGNNVNASAIAIGKAATGSTATAGYFGAATIYILNYTSATRTRTTASMSGNPAYGSMAAAVGLWTNTAAAITTVTLLPVSGTNFVAGSLVSLYGWV